MQLKYGPYSPSRLETAICGYSFYKQYVEPKEKGVALPKIEGMPQARGSAVHEVFEQITKSRLGGVQVLPPDTVRQWVAAAIDRHPAAIEETSAILHMAKLYTERFPEIESDAGIELRLAVKLVSQSVGGACKFETGDYGDPAAFARGRADIMSISADTTEAKVIDHKTQPNLEEADTFQMGFYAWVIWKIYPFLSQISTTLHFARYGTYSAPWIWTKRDLEDREEEILTRISIIENRTSWDPTPNKMCQYCPVIGECPVLKSVLVEDEQGVLRPRKDRLIIAGVTPKDVVDKAQWVAGLIHVIDQVRDEAIKNLKEYVKQVGSVSIYGVTYDYRASESIDWDKVNKGLREKTYEVFAKHKVDPKRFMSFNQTATKPIWHLENEGLVRDLAALFPRKASTRFDGYKS